jgi:hypothetical protein
MAETEKTVSYVWRLCIYAQLLHSLQKMSELFSHDERLRKIVEDATKNRASIEALKKEKFREMERVQQYAVNAQNNYQIIAGNRMNSDVDIQDALNNWERMEERAMLIRLEEKNLAE